MEPPRRSHAPSASFSAAFTGLLRSSRHSPVTTGGRRPSPLLYDTQSAAEGYLPKADALLRGRSGNAGTPSNEKWDTADAPRAKTRGSASALKTRRRFRLAARSKQGLALASAGPGLKRQVGPVCVVAGARAGPPAGSSSDCQDVCERLLREAHVFGDGGPESEPAQIEVFGPVLSLRFSTEDEAARIANSTPYELAWYVWTQDAVRISRLATQLQAGRVLSNGAPPVTSCELPFGGVGISGYGREGSQEGQFEFLRTKAVASQSSAL